MAETDRTVIVGASLPGGTLATELRSKGFAGPITLIGAQDAPPYERPPLSKQLLRGKQAGPGLGAGRRQPAGLGRGGHRAAHRHPH